MRGRPFCYAWVMANTRIVENPDQTAIVEWIEDILVSAQKQREATCPITIPGGSTPFPILQALTTKPYGRMVWDRIEIWPNDDRIVPQDHEASNTGKMRALLEPVGAHIAALDENSTPPHFALTWLGMGPDGHTASLFPNTDPQVSEEKSVMRLTPDPLPAHAPFDRITLTLPALLDTDAILLTLGGSDEKRAVLDEAMRGENDLPIARLLKAAEQRNIPVTVFA